jgi:predicted amidohydrolase YtcJ
VMVDGVPHGATAALLEPYCSHGPGAAAGAGELHHDEQALRELILRLDALGFQMHLHVMGDRGIRVTLDAIQTTREVNGTGQRHHIAHLSMIHPDDARRFGPLGITANMQALWAAPDPYVVPLIGEERMQAGYPFRALADSGADLAMGSDWPVSPAEPWLAIHVAVNRSFPLPPHLRPPGADAPNEGDGPEVLDAAQALTLTEAFAAYTSGSSALVLGDPGLLRVGARADLVVSTVDPFEVPSARLIEVASAVTVVAGRIVFERKDAA